MMYSKREAFFKQLSFSITEGKQARLFAQN